MSPFHAGGGGGGGGGAGAATQVFDGGSNTVPQPHSTALLTPVSHCGERQRSERAAPTVAEAMSCSSSKASLDRSRPSENEILVPIGDF